MTFAHLQPCVLWPEASVAARAAWRRSGWQVPPSASAGAAQRKGVMATSGLPAALYSLGRSAWAPRVVAVARHGALHALIRSTHRAAVEANTAVVAHAWREHAGAWAAIAPWCFVRVAARAGWMP